MSEKQMDRVMRAIMLWEGDFPPEWDDIPEQRMGRLRNQAKAAIRAAFTPIKGTPKNGQEAIVCCECSGQTGTVKWSHVSIYKEGYGWWDLEEGQGVPPLAIVGYIPVPEEQDG